MSRVIAASWPHTQRLSLEAASARIVELRSLLTASFPQLGQLVAERPGSDALEGFADVPSCTALLRAGETKHHVESAGDLVTHQLFALVPRGEDAVAELGVAFATQVADGMEPFEVTNSVRLTLNHMRASQAELEQMLRIVVKVFDPPWAFVGTPVVPASSRHADGVPRVGWITYLHRDYGKPSGAMPEGVTARPAENGRLIRAFEDHLDDEREDHLEAIERVRTWLDEEGLLRPHADVVANPHVSEPPPEAEPAAQPRKAPAPQPSAPPEVREPARVEALAAMTSDDTNPVLSDLPFVRGDGSAPASVASKLEPNVMMGATAEPVAKRGPATPFAGGALPMSLSKLTQLGASLTARPHDRTAILAELGLDETSFAELSQQLQAALAADPGLAKRYQSLYERMLGAELAKAQRR